MSAEKQTEKKSLVNKDGEVTKLTEWATMEADSVDDMIELFGKEGVAVSTGEELNGEYRLIRGPEKQLFLQKVQGCRTFVVRYNFSIGTESREFVSAYVIIDGHGKFIVNDSSKSGFYSQLKDIYEKRIAEGMSEQRAKSGVLAERGFESSKPYFYNTDTRKAIPRIEMNDFIKHPADKRAEAKPSWSLVF